MGVVAGGTYFWLRHAGVIKHSDKPAVVKTEKPQKANKIKKTVKTNKANKEDKLDKAKEQETFPPKQSIWDKGKKSLAGGITKVKSVAAVAKDFASVQGERAVNFGKDVVEDFNKSFVKTKEKEAASNAPTENTAGSE